MKILVTGSSGHLGEALVRTLRDAGNEVVGVDILARPFTTHLGSIVDRNFVQRALAGVQIVYHTATLHKPHVATHSRQDFIDTNLTGTLHLLEEAVMARAEAFIFTSTTSVFGDALVPPAGHPAAWVTEDVSAIPKNIYGVTKAAAEDLCQLFHRNERLPCIVLRTSRFFPEADDNPSAREAYDDGNLKVNELLHRRVDLDDVVSAHLLAAQHARAIGFRRYIISATTPFSKDDLMELRVDAPRVVRRRVPAYEIAYTKLNWKIPPVIDRVYVNDRARYELGWYPRHDFAHAIAQLNGGQDPRGSLARLVGSKGYHAETFAQGPYPV